MSIPLYVWAPVALFALMILPALFRMRQIRRMPSLSNVSFPEHFAAPPELAGPRPRKTRLTSAGMVPVFMGLVFLLGGSAWFLSCFPAAVQQKARTAALRHGSQETTAVVTGLRRTGHGDRLVSYAFTAHGAALAGECAVPWEHWRGLREAGPLPIRFLPSNPAINHPAAWEGPDSDMWWVACVLSAFIAATGIWGAVIPLRRDRELVAKGAAAAGVILKCFQGGRGGWVANYQFRTEDGTTAQGTSPCPNRLEIGSTVCVLYLPQAPRRNQPYCFQTAEGLKTSNLSYCVAV